MYIEKIESILLSSCDECGCTNRAEYEIHVAIFNIKLCKKCMEELIRKCNKMIS